MGARVALRVDPILQPSLDPHHFSLWLYKALTTATMPWAGTCDRFDSKGWCYLFCCYNKLPPSTGA